MRVTLAVVGRMRGGPMRTLFDGYATRIGWPLTVREVDVPQGRSGSSTMAAEAERLRSLLPRDGRIVALDEGGRDLRSAELAEVLGRWRDDGVRDVCFVIGGADGLHADLRDRADLVLAFGRQTWPHQLVRVMLAEQIYRTETILSGHPYHRA